MLKYLILKDWRGLNRISDRLNMPPDFLYDLQNGYVKKDVKSNLGVLTQRAGCAKFNVLALESGAASVGEDAYTKLLIQFNGADGATTDYTAESGQTVSLEGTAQLDTAQKKFGASSLLLDGNSDYATVPDNANWNFGTGDFTIDCWIRFAVLPSVGGTNYYICSQYEDANNYWGLAVLNTDKLDITFVDGTGKGNYRMTTAYSFAIDTWYHIAAVRTTTSCMMFIDGISQTLTEYTAISTNDVGAIVGDLQIGWLTGTQYFNGWIDELRISKGIARWTADFTRPTSAYSMTALDTPYGENPYVKVVYEAKWNGGSTDIIIRAGTAWGKYDSADSFDTIDGARTDDASGQCVMFKNELIMVDGGVPRKMTSAYAVSDLSADGNMPQKSDCVWVHRDKVWLNNTDAPMTAYFSKTNSANLGTSWTGSTDAGTIDLSTVLPEGDKILGFRTFGGLDSGLLAIICQKYTVIYSAGSNTYDFTFLQYFPTSCLSMNAAAYAGTDLIYPSRNSVTSLISSSKNQQLEIEPLSKYIESMYREYIDWLGSASEPTISGVFHKKLNHYYITIPIANNCQTLVYSLDIGNFVGRWIYPFTIYSWCERLDGSLLAGGNGYVYTMNSGTDDDGTTISWKASLPALYFANPMIYKKPITMEALVYAENADPTIYIDYWYGGVGTLITTTLTKEISLASGSVLYYWDAANSLWDQAYWAETAASFLYRTHDLLSRGRFMFVDIRHATNDANVTIPHMAIGYVLEGDN